MMIVTTKTTEARVVRKGDKCWGILYSDAGSHSEGWVNLDGNIKGSTASLGVNYLKKPSDNTYKNSHYTDELNKGRVVSTVQVVHTIMYDRIIDEN